MSKWRILLLIIIFIISGGFLFLGFYKAPLSQNHGKVSAELFLGEQKNQSLIVGFGGGEGGNAWASEHWKNTRDQFIQKGYAFLAVGYFGTVDSPTSLDRISLDAIHKQITQLAKHPKINSQKIALIGGSKGAELILNLASRYDTYKAVIAIVPSHVSFPAVTVQMNTSSWSFQNKEVNYVRAPFKIITPTLQGDLLTAHQMMLEDPKEVKNALIQVEKIKGNILLMSATMDEMWPSKFMSEEIIKRLKSKKFTYHYEHISYEGRHTEPLKHFDDVFLFLQNYFD